MFSLRLLDKAKGDTSRRYSFEKQKWMLYLFQNHRKFCSGLCFLICLVCAQNGNVKSAINERMVQTTILLYGNSKMRWIWCLYKKSNASHNRAIAVKSRVLKRIKQEFDANLTLEIVPTVYVGEVSPCLAPSSQVIKFCYESGTDIDIDLYVFDLADDPGRLWAQLAFARTSHYDLHLRWSDLPIMFSTVSYASFQWAE